MLEEEQAVQQALEQLDQVLKNNDIIIRYRNIQQRVKQNQHLTELTEEIRQAQKEAVNFDHYEKPEAAKEALARADRLTKEFDEHPQVIAYRESLEEANDLLQYITKRIQKEVNDRIESDGVCETSPRQ